MATRKITRKVITPVKPIEPRKVVPVVQAKAVTLEKQPERVEEVKTEEGYQKPIRAKKECYFCQSKTTPSFTDLSNLRRLLTDRAKIVAKERSGICSKHQRGVAKNIKYARHLSLLPFVPKI